MNLKKLKKLITVLLSVSTLASMCACGQTAEENQEESKKTSQDTQKEVSEIASSENASEEAGVVFPLEESVTLKAVMFDSSDIDFENNTVLQELAETTNINFEWTFANKEKLLMLLNSGEYPDMVCGITLSNEEIEKYGVQEGFFVPLDDLINEAAPNIVSLFEKYPLWDESQRRSDGHIYGIRNVSDGGENHGSAPYKMFMNTEWLDAVGMDIPATTEELKEVLMAFKTQDPNGNGKADEIPLTCSNSGHIYYYLLNAFGYFQGEWVYYQDGVQHSILDQDYIKEGLAYINDLYENGLIDQAGFTQDNNQLLAVGSNEEDVIVGAVSHLHIGTLVDLYSERYNAYKVMEPLKGPGGYKATVVSPNVLSGGSFFITDTCEYPEVAMAVCDLMTTEYWVNRYTLGIQGVDWDYADEGQVNREGAPALVQNLRMPQCYDICMSEGKKCPNILRATWQPLNDTNSLWWAMEGDLMHPDNYYHRITYDYYQSYKPYAADIDVVYNLNFGDNADSYAQIKTAINDYVGNAIVEFCMGIRDVEKDWDAYLADLEQLGYYEMLEMHQVAHDAKYK